MNLRLLWNKFRQNAPEPKCFLTKRRSHPIIARCGREAFIKNQIQNFEHRRKTGSAL